MSQTAIALALASISTCGRPTKPSSALSGRLRPCYVSRVKLTQTVVYLCAMLVGCGTGGVAVTPVLAPAAVGWAGSEGLEASRSYLRWSPLRNL